jgi:methylglutaconyl-CoA hydratase
VDAGEEAALQDAERIATLFHTLHELPKPTIAAVNGSAIAGGMGIATICDLTLAVPEAKFGYTEVRIGFIPAIVSAYLRIQIGDKRARDLLLTGRLIGAEEAAALGLVTRVVPEPELMREARSVAEKLTRNSPAAMAATKRLLSRFAERRLLDEIDGAIRASVQMRAHADFREGVSAFLEKREPKWS